MYVAQRAMAVSASFRLPFIAPNFATFLTPSADVLLASNSYYPLYIN